MKTFCPGKLAKSYKLKADENQLELCFPRPCVSATTHFDVLQQEVHLIARESIAQNSRGS